MAPRSSLANRVHRLGGNKPLTARNAKMSGGAHAYPPPSLAPANYLKSNTFNKRDIINIYIYIHIIIYIICIYTHREREETLIREAVFDQPSCVSK